MDYTLTKALCWLIHHTLKLGTIHSIVEEIVASCDVLVKKKCEMRSTVTSVSIDIAVLIEVIVLLLRYLSFSEQNFVFKMFKCNSFDL